MRAASSKQQILVEAGGGGNPYPRAVTLGGQGCFKGGKPLFDAVVMGQGVFLC